jgi:hypothetical protein
MGSVPVWPEECILLGGDGIYTGSKQKYLGFNNPVGRARS